ncbi:MAG: hypothetical protein ABI333_26755 [bacterium]
MADGQSKNGGGPRDPTIPPIAPDSPTTTAEMGTVVLSRYRVVDRDAGRFIVAEDSRNMQLHVRPGLTVTEEDRKNYPEYTIFLDGAYNGAPFLDNERWQYSFDHHNGCVRSFTLATCQQVAVMLLKGLPINEGEWRMYVNQPDLDALLAAWLLMNHRDLLADQAALLRRVMPLLHVEGIIDSHGLEMAALTGLDEKQYDIQKTRLDQLMTPEREHRSAGTWANLDMVEYSCDRLAAIDALLAEAGMLRERAQVEVIATRDIQGDKQVVLCRSTGGIYEVEARLRELLGKALGVIILETGERKYTLKQVDSFLSRDLVALYQALNARDPEAVSQSDSGANLWGGSADIGGSPRATGSGLAADEILDITSRVYRGTSWFRRLLSKKR